MWPLFLVATFILAIIITVKRIPKKPTGSADTPSTDNTASTENPTTAKKPAADNAPSGKAANTAPQQPAPKKAEKPNTPKNPDQELVKKIMLWGIIGCVIIAIGLCIAIEVTGDPDAVGIGFGIVMAVIIVGSLLPNKNKLKPTKYKEYYIDELKRIHYPRDLDFGQELIRYSEYNEHIYLKPIPITQRNEYIIDGKGNKVDIRSKNFIMHDSDGNICHIKMI